MSENKSSQHMLHRRAILAKWTCRVAAALTVLGLVMIWSRDDLLMAAVACGLGSDAVFTITPTARIIILLAATVPGSLFVWSLLILAAIFHRIERGQVMVEANARALSRVGVLFLSFAGLSVIAQTISVLAATYANPAGERMLSITFGSPQISALVTGITFFAIGLVLREAVRMAKENESFV